MRLYVWVGLRICDSVAISGKQLFFVKDNDISILNVLCLDGPSLALRVAKEKEYGLMKIAITVWGNRISPVFDAASTLLLVELQDRAVVDRQVKMFQPSRHDSFITLLKDAGVHLLVCGAMCEPAVQRVEASGIDVVPFVAGEVESLIESYLQERGFSDFAMPGCRHGRCCRGRYKRVKSQG